MEIFLIIALRAILGLGFAGCLLVQVLLPSIAQEAGGGYRETASLVSPYSVAGIVAFASVQVSLVIVWRLVSLVSLNSLFSAPAVWGINVLALCLALAAGLPAAVLFHLLFIVGVGGPGILLLLGAVVSAGLGLTLLTLVLRRVMVTTIRQFKELGLEA